MRLRSPVLAPLVLASLACAWPRPALADGMGGLGAAAIGGALILIGGISLGGSLVCLVLALVHHRARKPATQVLALVALILGVGGHLYFAWLLEELALVLIAGVPLTVASVVVYWRAGPARDEAGEPFRAAAPIAAAIVAGLVVSALIYARALHEAGEQLEQDALRELDEAHARVRDPATPEHERAAALRRVAGTHRCDLRDLDLSGASLVDVRLDGCELAGLDLRDADLTKLYAPHMDLREVGLRGATLREAMIEAVDLSGVDLRDVDLRGASLVDADLRDADLRGADLRGAYISHCKIAGAKVSAAQLASASEFWAFDELDPAVAAELEALRAARRDRAP